MRIARVEDFTLVGITAGNAASRFKCDYGPQSYTRIRLFCNEGFRQESGGQHVSGSCLRIIVWRPDGVLIAGKG